MIDTIGGSRVVVDRVVMRWRILREITPLDIVSAIEGEVCEPVWCDVRDANSALSEERE